MTAAFQRVKARARIAVKRMATTIHIRHKFDCERRGFGAAQFNKCF